MAGTERVTGSPTICLSSLLLSMLLPNSPFPAHHTSTAFQLTSRAITPCPEAAQRCITCTCFFPVKPGKLLPCWAKVGAGGIDTGIWWHDGGILLQSAALCFTPQGHSAFLPQTAKPRSAGGNPQGGGVSRRGLTWLLLVVRGRAGLQGKVSPPGAVLAPLLCNRAEGAWALLAGTYPALAGPPSPPALHMDFQTELSHFYTQQSIILFESLHCLPSGPSPEKSTPCAPQGT